MKVLVLSVKTYADPATRKVFECLASRGVEVLLALPHRIKHPLFPNVIPNTPWPTPGVELIRLDTWNNHWNPTHLVFKGIPALIRNRRPDIIHCVMEPWSLTCLEVLACLWTMSRRPVFGVQACETKPRQGGRLERSVRTFLYRAVVSRCDYFVGWSRPVISAAAALGLNGKPLAIAPAVGTNMSCFRPPESGEKELLRREMGLGGPDDFVVGYAGRFVEQKGLRDLLAAMDAVRRTNDRVRLALMGRGPLEPWLSSVAASRPWLAVLGPRDQDGVAAFMRALDVLCQPSRTTSRWEEQFGLVLAEAMASRLPVLGSNCGAIPEVLGDAGGIFPEGNVGALEASIVQLASDAERLGRLGDIARARAEGAYSADAVARALLSTWRAVR